MLNKENLNIAYVKRSRIWLLLLSMIIGGAITGICLVAAWHLGPSIYMAANGISNLSDLSEDLGFGLLFFLGMSALAIVLWPLASLIAYARLTRISKSS